MASPEGCQVYRHNASILPQRASGIALGRVNLRFNTIFLFSGMARDKEEEYYPYPLSPDPFAQKG
jgi:hypothetical protein